MVKFYILEAFVENSNLTQNQWNKILPSLANETEINLTNRTDIKYLPDNLKCEKSLILIGTNIKNFLKIYK